MKDLTPQVAGCLAAMADQSAVSFDQGGISVVSPVGSPFIEKPDPVSFSRLIDS
jgi:hypothetical protein